MNTSNSVGSAFGGKKKQATNFLISTSPYASLREKSIIWNVPIDSKEFAKRLDDEDSLARIRPLFSIPKKGDLPFTDRELVDEDEDCIYLCGQSLGLKPKSTDEYCLEVLNNWATKGVHSHFTGSLPAAVCDIPAKNPMAKLVGALPGEVAVMNGLTVNLHLLLASFYRPTNKRFKIMIEEHAFSSDIFAVKSHLNFHGYEPEAALLLMKPRQGEYLIREEDIVKQINMEGESVALLLLPGIHYYTGQFIEIKRLTEAAHAKGIIVGVDGAHAVGNVSLQLHDWNVDFAVWCSYKYLNSGPGCLGAMFVHERLTENGGDATFPMFRGWWGNNMKTRFLMKEEFDPCSGADMFRISNPPPLLAAALMASLDIFSQTSMEEIRQKQFHLTGYLEFLLKKYFTKEKCNTDGPFVEIITPSNPSQRGSQLSLMFSVPLNRVQELLQKSGVVCDVRAPNVMRVSPVPLYNTFTDVFNFVSILRESFDELAEIDQGIILTDSAEEAISHEYFKDNSSNNSSDPTSASSSSSSIISSSDSEPDSSETTLNE